eukprot:SAG22_NODE_23_length_31399_cov_35.631313_6_plen_553_part_00
MEFVNILKSGRVFLLELNRQVTRLHRQVCETLLLSPVEAQTLTMSRLMSIDELRTELWKLTGQRPDGRMGAARLRALLLKEEARRETWRGPAGPRPALQLCGLLIAAARPAAAQGGARATFGAAIWSSRNIWCRHDICTDIGNDCCAPDGEGRGCSVPGYEVRPGGTTSYAPCLSSFGEEAIYQCCNGPPDSGLSDLQGVFAPRHSGAAGATGRTRGGSALRELPPSKLGLLTICGSPKPRDGFTTAAVAAAEQVCCSVGPGEYPGLTLTTCPCPVQRGVRWVDVPPGCMLGVKELENPGVVVRELPPGNHSAEWFDLERLDHKLLALNCSAFQAAAELVDGECAAARHDRGLGGQSVADVQDNSNHDNSNHDWLLMLRNHALLMQGSSVLLTVRARKLKSTTAVLIFRMIFGCGIAGPRPATPATLPVFLPPRRQQAACKHFDRFWRLPCMPGICFWITLFGGLIVGDPAVFYPAILIGLVSWAFSPSFMFVGLKPDPLPGDPGAPADPPQSIARVRLLAAPDDNAALHIGDRVLAKLDEGAAGGIRLLSI